MAWRSVNPLQSGETPWLVNLNLIVGGHGKENVPGGPAVPVRSPAVDNIYLDVANARRLRDELDVAIQELEEAKAGTLTRPTVRNQTFDLDLFVEKGAP